MLVDHLLNVRLGLGTVYMLNCDKPASLSKVPALVDTYISLCFTVVYRTSGVNRDTVLPLVATLMSVVSVLGQLAAAWSPSWNWDTVNSPVPSGRKQPACKILYDFAALRRIRAPAMTHSLRGEAQEV